MTINGDHNSDVFLIQFFHKGLKMKFTTHFPTKDGPGFYKPGAAMLRIDFRDSMEIRTLIRCLERFIHQAERTTGEWEQIL